MKTSKAAIVTGASRGIGRAVALRLGQDGHAVAVNYVSREVDARDVVDALMAAGGTAVAIRADVSLAAELDEFVEYKHITITSAPGCEALHPRPHREAGQ
jgi:3-oxoacyl-[acyl-carrier protein] reductase